MPSLLRALVEMLHARGLGQALPALNMFRVNDNAKLALGRQTDAEIYHNGGNFILIMILDTYIYEIM